MTPLARKTIRTKPTKDIIMTFRVTPQVKALIELAAMKREISTTELIRIAVLTEVLG